MRRHLLPTVLLAAAALVAQPAIAVLTPEPAAAASSSSTPTLKAGAKGAAVLRVQKDLGVRQSGTFDAATVSAVKSFQRANRLAASGTVTSSTWAALVRLEKSVASAKSSFARSRSVASDALAKQLSRVNSEASVGLKTPADAAMLRGRLDTMRRALDTAAAAVSRAGTLAQVRAQAGLPGRVVAGAAVVAAQSSAVGIARAEQFQAGVKTNLQQIYVQGCDERYVSPAVDAAARAKVLKAAEAWRVTVAPAATALLSTDPLASTAKARTDAYRQMEKSMLKTATGRAYDNALSEYVTLWLF